MMSEFVKVYFYEASANCDPSSRRFAGKSLFASEGWSASLVGSGVRVEHPKFGSYEVFGVRFRVFTTEDEHKLSESLLDRMNIPVELRASRLDRVSPSILPTVTNYCKNVREFVTDGLGFVMHGGPGVGKSAAAAVMAMEAVRGGKSVLFGRPVELREWLRFRIDFDNESSVQGRLRQVGFLVMDDLKVEDFPPKETIFSLDSFCDLVEHRVAQKRATTITTRLPPNLFAATFPKMSEILRAKSAYLEVKGPNRRDDEAVRTEQRLLVRTEIPEDNVVPQSKDSTEATDNVVPSKRSPEPKRIRIPGLPKK